MASVKKYNGSWRATVKRKGFKTPYIPGKQTQQDRIRLAGRLSRIMEIAERQELGE